MKRSILVVVTLVAAAALFTAGFFAHRHRLHRFLPGIGTARPGFDRTIVRPRSPALAVLQSLPYIGGAGNAGDETGVLRWERGIALDGLNFYTSLQKQAILMDMEGRVLHRWRHPIYDDAGEAALKDGTPSYQAWQHSHLFDDGELLIVMEEERLIRIDRNSKILWTFDGRFHHGVDVDADGMIYALTWEPEDRPEVHANQKTLVDSLLVLTPDGRLLRKRSLLDLVEATPYRFLLPSVADRRFATEKPLDILHTNHVEVFDGSLERLGPLYGQNNLLVSFRNINAIAILDGDLERILWLWGPSNLSLQHDPTILPNGNVLLFDNGTRHSRVIEIDPRTNRITWSYGPVEDFFSANRGSAERLANGNTLITESDRARVFEVTPAGEIVWEFVNPDRNAKGESRVIFRMTRVSRDAVRFIGRAGA